MFSNAKHLESECSNMFFTKSINIWSPPVTNIFVKPWWLGSGASWPGLRNWELGIMDWEHQLPRNATSVLYVWCHCALVAATACLLINFRSRRSPNSASNQLTRSSSYLHHHHYHHCHKHLMQMQINGWPWHICTTCKFIFKSFPTAFRIKYLNYILVHLGSCDRFSI